jgi:hypothetical protein
MAIFRVEKTTNYTVMSNHHLRNKSLTLKAKGLLSQMLSLPDEWNYTLKGLALINRESVEAIRTAVLELENEGYIVRKQKRDEKGRMSDIEYTVYERLQRRGVAPPDERTQTQSEPSPDYPVSENPITDNPISENPTQLNKEVINNKESSNKESINPILSSFPQPNGIDKEKDVGFKNIESALRENIQIDALLEAHPKDAGILREMFGLIVDTATSGRHQVMISGSRYSPGFVRARLLRLTGHHLLYVLDCLKENTTKVRNIKSYMLTALFNAPITIDSFYDSRVRHDIAHGLI